MTANISSRSPVEDLHRPLSEQPEPSNQRLLTELHYDFSRDYSLPNLVGAYFKLSGQVEQGETKGYFPVVTSVKQVNADVVEVRRKFVFRNSLKL